MQRSFSIREAITFGWQTLLNNVLLFAQIWGIMTGLSAVGYLVQNLPLPNQLIQIFSFTVAVVWWVLVVGLVHIVLECHDKGASGIHHLWSHIEQVPHFFIATLIFVSPLLALTVLGTAIALAMGKSPFLFLGMMYISPIGWIILAACAIVCVRLSMYIFLVPDKQEGPVQALKRSWQITHGNLVHLIMFALLAGLPMVVLAGLLEPLKYFLPGFVAVLSTLVSTAYSYMALLAYVFIYRKLSNNAVASRTAGS